MPAPPHLKRSHAVLLVLAVLLVHVWMLSGTPLWWTPDQKQTLRPQAMVTRTIEASTPRAAQKPAVKPNRVARTQPNDIPQSTPQPLIDVEPPTPTPTQTQAPPFDHTQALADLTAPVALPARSASAVDLPPFKRAETSAPDASNLAQDTRFKPPPLPCCATNCKANPKG